MYVFPSSYITQITHWKTETTKFEGSSPYFTKTGVITTKIKFSLETTKANVEWYCFPSLSHKSHPWKTGTTKFGWFTNFKKKWWLKSQKFETFLGTTNENVEWACFCIYIYSSEVSMFLKWQTFPEKVLRESFTMFHQVSIKEAKW